MCVFLQLKRITCLRCWWFALHNFQFLPFQRLSLSLSCFFLVNILWSVTCNCTYRITFVVFAHCTGSASFFLRSKKQTHNQDDVSWFLLYMCMCFWIGRKLWFENILSDFIVHHIPFQKKKKKLKQLVCIDHVLSFVSGFSFVICFCFFSCSLELSDKRTKTSKKIDAFHVNHFKSR